MRGCCLFFKMGGPPKKNDPYKWSVINPINGFPCLFLDNPYKWSVTNPLNGLINEIILCFFTPISVELQYFTLTGDFGAHLADDS